MQILKSVTVHRGINRMHRNITNKPLALTSLLPKRNVGRHVLCVGAVLGSRLTVKQRRCAWIRPEEKTKSYVGWGWGSLPNLRPNLLPMR